jgi:NOL1/NOP2/sun family putative RNA methylase
MYEKLLESLGIENKDMKNFHMPQYIRVNTLRIQEEELLKRLKKKNVKLKKVPYLKHGYELETSDFNLASTEEYLMGYFYIQDAASQVPPEVLDPKETDTVLDMCAAPGSKTTYLSQLMNNKGLIVALDIIPRRLEALKNNIERTGAKNVAIYNKDGLFASDLGYKFDKILLDAPCSGNYALTDYVQRTEDDLAKKSVVQKKLLKAANQVLKPGGTLVYSTCSIETKENEEVIQWALENLPLELQNIDKNLHSGLIKETKRFFPHLDNTQGFFIAKLKKKSDDD